MTIITHQGTQLHTVGELPPVGSQAPDFTMTKDDLSEIRLSDCLGRKTILNIFPSLDTPICAKTMRKFNAIADLYPELQILCVSLDLPFAQKRFCSEEHLENIIPVSIFRNTEFGDLYGIRITDGEFAGLLSRVVIVLDENGKIIHTEQVRELMNEPNYKEIISSIVGKSRV